MRWREFTLLILVGMALLQVGNWVVREPMVEVTSAPSKTLVSTFTPAHSVVGRAQESTYPDTIVPGPPPPGTVLIRLEILKIDFVSSVFPVGLEDKGGEVVLGKPTMDTVWDLDLSDPLVQAYGWGGRNYVVWAHRADWASRWPELEIGDKILFFTVNHSEEKGFYGIYYQAVVASWRIIPIIPVEVETDFYQASETPMLTLVTCHPENDPDPQFRLVIRALFFPALTE